MSLCDSLSVAIEKWLGERDIRSLSMLARRASVSYSTIRRIMQKETIPSQPIALAIAAIVMDSDECKKFIDTHFPALGEWREGTRDYKINPDLSQYLTLPDHARIIAMAATDSGTTRKAIEKLLGSEGERALQELMNEDVIFEHLNGRIEASEKLFQSIDSRHILSQISMWAKIFDHENVAKPAHASYEFATEGLNEEGLSRLNEVKKAHFKQIEEILSDKRLRGDIVVYAASFHNVLCDGEGGTDK